jgi:hypothetical protein
MWKANRDGRSVTDPPNKSLYVPRRLSNNKLYFLAAWRSGRHDTKFFCVVHLSSPAFANKRQRIVLAFFIESCLIERFPAYVDTSQRPQSNQLQTGKTWGHCYLSSVYGAFRVLYQSGNLLCIARRYQSLKAVIFNDYCHSLLISAQAL